MFKNLAICFVVVAALVACTGSDCEIENHGYGGYYQPVYDYIVPTYYDPYYYEYEPVVYYDDCGWYCY